MILRAPETIRDQYDRPLAGAQVYVYNQDGSLATLTIDGTTPLTQPVNTDAFGSYSYWANAGFYTEETWFGGKKLWVEANLAVGPQNASDPNYTYAINTLSPGSSATLIASGTYPNITLTFGIPQGTAGTSGALSNGTYGDIVVTSAGAVLTVGAGAITLAKMANLAANSFLANNTGSAATPIALTVSQAKTLLALVKGDVGLGNVDNTADTTKPVSTAQQTALNALLVSPALTGTPTLPTAAVGTNTTQAASTAYVMAAKAPVGQTISSSATVTPTFSDDFIEITAQAVGLTLANPTGSAVNMWGAVDRIKDNGTPQTIAFGTQYRGVGLTLPTTTVAGKTTVLGRIFNSALTKWDVVSVAQE